MDEKELFNKDTMYWREVNATSSGLTAVLELNEEIEIDGKQTNALRCSLLPYESHSVEYEMENGGAFKKNEVKSWPFVLLSDKAAYEDSSTSSGDKLSLLRSVNHSLIQSIRLLDENGEEVLHKAKI